MTHAEAIAAIKANWPTENYTMLREALTLACAALASPPAEDENRAKLAEVIRDVAQRLESCGVMGRDLHLRTCSGDEDTPCNCGADDPAEVLRGVADALIWPTAAQAPPASDPPGLVALARETRDIVDGYDDQLPSVKVAQGTPFAVAVGLMRRWLLAYPLPASPQAETKGDE